MKKILVTGGAGFIGSNVALELEKQGHEVTIVDNFSSGTRNNLKKFKGKIIEVDVSEPFEVEPHDAIIHEASITDPRHDNDEETYNKNVEGFKVILNLAKQWKAKVVYASTAGMYGNGPTPMQEDQKKELISSYAKSKYEMDCIAEKLFGEMHIVGLRYFNVFGPREAHKGRPASMIYHLAKQIKAGKNPRIFKMGEQIRDHVYVKDAVDATLKAMDAPQSCIVNVGTGIGTDFNAVIKAIDNALGVESTIEYFDNPYDLKTYQSNTQAETTRAQEFLGFTASWKFKNAVKDYMEWLKE